MRQRGASALFPELIATNESQSFGDKIYYNWAKALVLQLDGNPRELCFHSFRHYAIAHLKELPEVSEKQRRDLVGHSGGDVHDEQYDVATSMTVMSGVVAKLPRLF
jgi:integrase